MREACPKCGLSEVEGPECPRCGVVVPLYRDYRAAMRVPLEEPRAVGGSAGTTLRPAGFWIRAGAVLLDWGFLVVVQLAASALLALLWGGAPAGSRTLQATRAGFRWLFPLVYAVVFHWLFGQTMGKMILRIRVVAADGQELTPGRAAGRALAWGLSLLAVGAGHVLAGLRQDRRALHDLLAGTRVERL